MQNNRRKQLVTSFKMATVAAMLVVVWVFIDYSFNIGQLSQTYRFTIPELKPNQPVLLKSESMLIVLAHYDDDIIRKFTDSSYSIVLLKTDIELRTDERGYFVAMAYGTDIGCPLLITQDHFKESCSKARYDLLGRSLQPQRYKDLKIPAYSWNKNFTALTIEQD